MTFSPHIAKKIFLFGLSCLVVAGAGAADALSQAFPNGEFEDRSVFGRVDGHVEIGGSFGLNGSGGVRLRAAGSKGYEYRLVCASRLKAKRKYIFSVARRAHGNVQLHTGWQCWGKDGWCRGQSWNTKVTPLDGGWERVEMTVFLKDPEWETGELRFLLKVSPKGGKTAGPDDWVDYDCASIREGTPEWYFANVWPTHNVIHGETGRVRLHSGFLGDFVPSGGPGRYEVSLKAEDGRVLSARAVEPAANTFTVSFGRLDYRGKAVLETELSDPVTKKVCGRRTLEVTVVSARRPGKGEVAITEKGDVRIDGKPYMPLGFFTSIARRGDIGHARRELKKISDAGFNCIMEYWMNSFQYGDKLDDFYAACASNGIKVLYNFSGAYKTPEKMDEHMAVARMQLDNGAPLLGWYVLDEASFTHLPAIRKLRRRLNELTPGIPTWQVNIREIDPFLDTADVLGGDHYLIGRNQGVLKQMDAYMESASASGAAAMWYCPQCFNWANYDPEARKNREKYLAKDDEPTLNEMLSIAFLYASHGVKGFIFYMYDDIFAGPVPGLYERRWNDVKKVGRVMRSLEPFIMSGRPIENVPVTDVRGKTRVSVLRDGKGHARVLAVGLDYANEAVFRLPDDCRNVASVFGNAAREPDGSWRFKAGKRSCDMLKVRAGDVKAR